MPVSDVQANDEEPTFRPAFTLTQDCEPSADIPRGVVLRDHPSQPRRCTSFQQSSPLRSRRSDGNTMPAPAVTSPERFAGHEETVAQIPPTGVHAVKGDIHGRVATSPCSGSPSSWNWLTKFASKTHTSPTRMRVGARSWPILGASWTKLVLSSTPCRLTSQTRLPSFTASIRQPSSFLS